MLSDQEKNQLRQTIQSNQHEIFVVSMEEMDAIVRSNPKSSLGNIQATWQKFKSKAEASASYYASADDLRTLSKLVGDLGSFGARAYVKTYGGKPHIVLKGLPGLRKVLTGTKYGIANPKVVTMGLGKAGAIHAAKSGGIISIVLLSVYRVIDYILTDEATLSSLIGTLATDVVKVGIATGASIGAASAIAAAGFTLAIGPILAVVIVGIGVSVALSAIDSQYGITNRVIAGLDEISDTLDYKIKQAKANITGALEEAVDSVIDYTIDTAKNIIIDMARHQLNKLLSPLPLRVL